MKTIGIASVFVFIASAILADIRTTGTTYTDSIQSYDTLAKGEVELIYPSPFEGYASRSLTRDLRYVSRSYESEIINEFGEALYFKMVLMTVSKKGSNDKPNHDFCHPESVMNVESLKTQYSKKSGFWDFYFEEDNFSSHRIMDDTLYFSFGTNDPKIIDWFKRNRNDFVSELRKKKNESK